MKVIIPDTRLIPTLGKGPFNKPVEISHEVFVALQLAGYHVRKYTELPKCKTSKIDEVKESDTTNDVDEDTVEDNVVEDTVEDTVVEDTVVEDTVEDTVVEDIVEDTVVEDTVVEDIVEDTVVSDEAEFTRADLESKTVSELKDICTTKGIEFKYKNTKSELIDLILA